MRNHSKLFVAAVVAAGTFAGVSVSSAADLAARPYTKAPVIAAPIYDWTGFYIGGNIGYSWGRSDNTATLVNGAGTVLFTDAVGRDMNGVIGGGQVGYNWQMASWLWGLEADIQGSGQKGSRDFICPTGVCTPNFGVIAVFPGPAVPVTLSQKLDWFGTVRGRVGVLATPTVLLYATGGLAYGDVQTSATIAGLGVTSSSNTRVGWTVGAGVEGSIGGNWTAKLEYLYMDIGRTSGTFATTVGAFGGGLLAANFNSRVTDNILRVGVNYRFGGPVVARY
jgi:outer membrane immunogenic protein